MLYCILLKWSRDKRIDVIVTPHTRAHNAVDGSDR
jgi:hypothetical protein